MQEFRNEDGSVIVFDLISAIQANKQYLSDIDGAIGDGDHGINMNKGFTMCGEKLKEEPGNLSSSLLTLAKILMTNIGGSMGPLYGMFFKAMGKAVKGRELIGVKDFGDMIEGAKTQIGEISEAKIGDKTLMDVLIPAAEAYSRATAGGKSFVESLDEMTEAARRGRDSTVDLIAKVGRSSRLGERSKGVMDAGAASCCLILEKMAGSIRKLIRE